MKLNKGYTPNQNKVLYFIYDNPLLTRLDIAQKMGLSIVSIINFVKDFIKDGIVVESTVLESRGGRRPTTLMINPEYAYVLALDIGAYSIKLGVLNIIGDVVYREEIINDCKVIPSTTISISLLLDKLNLLLKKYNKKRCLGIGIGISGIVDYKNKTVLSCPNIAGWKNANLQKSIGNSLKLPIMVDTSARWFAIAENKKSKGKEIIISIFLGYSISAGIVINNEVLRGTEGFAGEIGHIQVMDSNYRCTCGSFGCLELFVSLPEIKSAIRLALESKDITVDRINNLYHNNDLKVKDCFNGVITKLGKVIAEIVKLYNPDRIVMDGGVIRAFPQIIDLLNNYVKSNLCDFLSSKVVIEKTSIKNDVALVGICHEFARRFLN